LKILPEPTTTSATTRIAVLATTNAPITAGLTRLLMAAYLVASFLFVRRNFRTSLAREAATKSRVIFTA
jgi:hypothetical protein